jgi:hypothetical protein
MTEPRTPDTDPILMLLPAERPWAFDRLPFEEQKWRARIFLAVWIQSGGAAHEAARTAFAWQNALLDYANDPEIPLADYKAWVERNFTLEVIRDGLDSLNTPAEEPA